MYLLHCKVALQAKLMRFAADSDDPPAPLDDPDVKLDRKGRRPAWLPTLVASAPTSRPLRPSISAWPMKQSLVANPYNQRGSSKVVAVSHGFNPCGRLGLRLICSKRNYAVASETMAMSLS